MTRITYDTEFIDDGKTIELISIGMVREDTGETLYAVSREFDTAKVLEHEWLRKNVWPHLPIRDCEKGKRCHGKPQQHLDRDDPDVRPRRQIARMVERFILNTPNPELWAYYSDYDHVVLMQLFGAMVDKPKGVPMHTMDIKQEAVRLGVQPEDIPKQVLGEHNALLDAKHNLVMLKFLDKVASDVEMELLKAHGLVPENVTIRETRS